MKKLPFHKLTLDRKICRFLQANGPQSIDTIAGHVLGCGDGNRRRVANLIGRLRHEGMISPLDPNESPIRFQVALPPLAPPGWHQPKPAPRPQRPQTDRPDATRGRSNHSPTGSTPSATRTNHIKTDNMNTDIQSIARSITAADPLAAEFLINHMRDRTSQSRKTTAETVRHKLGPRYRNLPWERFLEILDIFEHHGLGQVTNRTPASGALIHWARPPMLPLLAGALAEIKSAHPAMSAAATVPTLPSISATDPGLPEGLTPPPPASTDPASDPMVLCMIAKSAFDKLSRLAPLFVLGFVTDPSGHARFQP